MHHYFMHTWQSRAVSSNWTPFKTTLQTLNPCPTVPGQWGIDATLVVTAPVRADTDGHSVGTYVRPLDCGDLEA